MMRWPIANRPVSHSTDPILSFQYLLKDFLFVLLSNYIGKCKKMFNSAHVCNKVTSVV